MSKPFTFVQDPDQLPPALAGAVYALGNFDGVHRGHKAVIGRAIALAQRLGRPSAVLTFEPHPADYFAGRQVVERITPVNAHVLALQRQGIDGVVILSFDARFAGMPPEDFIAKILVGRLGASGVVAGYDHHFGRARTGTPEFLREVGTRHGLVVEIVEEVAAGGGTSGAVHSTGVRIAITDGNMALARTLLGHDFFVVGTVEHGQKLGRTLGFPTANITLDPAIRLAFGIYAVRLTVEGRTFDGVASYGRRPTVDNGAPMLEVFVFDFDGDLYGKRVEVALVEWIRPELKFDGLESLKAQIADDVEKARALLRV